MKVLIQRLKESLRKYSWYRWCEANDLKVLLNKVRGLKQKLTHDNLWDVSLGAILACTGLWLYLNVTDMDKAVIIILPALFSFWNEVINAIDSKKFSIIDVVLRTLIGIILYFIV